MALKGVPRCPFAAKKTNENENKSNSEMYNGLGHEEGFLNFYPFSAGERSCPAKNLGLQVIRKVVVTNFHRFLF